MSEGERSKERKVKGAIAAGHPKTAEAGRLILAAGGNAFDAAVAASLAACVVEPMLTSLGGGGFLLAHPAQGSPVLFDFFTQTPRQRPQNPDFYAVSVNFGEAVQEFQVGLGSIAVPGTLAGLLRVQEKLGQLPRSVVFEPAIALAKTGVILNRFQAYCIQILEPILTLSPPGQAAYQRQTGQRMLAVGDRLHLAHLADSLAHFAETGADSLYRGELAERMVRDSQDQGGTLTRADLENYRVVERSPLKFCYRDRTLLTNPPPSSGGTLIAFSLALLESLDLNEGFGNAQHLNALLETMRVTNAARQAGYDERLYEPGIAQTFLGPENLEAWRSQLGSLTRPPDSQLGSTTHISVIDDAGNAASVTASNGEGSGYFIPGTGIMLNNMLGEADLNPQGFHQWVPNRRLSSMMAPTLVLRAGKPEFALGSGGSNRIRTAILQVLCNLLDFRMPLSEAIQAPRLHAEAGVLHWEPGWSPALIEAWVNQNHPQKLLSLGLESQASRWQDNAWSEPNMFFGGVHAVQKNADGSFTGAGDPRRDGAFDHIG